MTAINESVRARDFYLFIYVRNVIYRRLICINKTNRVYKKFPHSHTQNVRLYMYDYKKCNNPVILC